MAISNACLRYAKETHECPYCKSKLSCCATPPMHVGDGLGWGTDVFFVCLNDECSLFVTGWEHIETQYGKVGSYRYMVLPGDKKGAPMMVGSKIAFTGSEISLEEMQNQNERHVKEKESLKQLDTCVKEKDITPVIFLITDEESRRLKKRKLVEGRRSNLYVSAKIAALINDKAAYIKHRAFDRNHYKKMILSFLEQYGSAGRKEIEDLLMSKLSDTLNLKQKRNKIGNLLFEMAHKDQSIQFVGPRKSGQWHLK